MDAIHQPVTCRWVDSPALALARARAAHPGRDVLLLREGVTLDEPASRRLLAAWRDGDWDVLSPLDGRWPLGEDADAAAWAPRRSSTNRAYSSAFFTGSGSRSR